jgi:hypothetical protein
MKFSEIDSRAVHDGLWEKTDTMPFDELIVSWNAFRPLQGKYLIEISVRSLKSPEWSEWLPYAEWGASHQKTFDSRGPIASSYQDIVRLQQGRLADGFRIRVSALDGASLARDMSLYANIAHLERFSIDSPPSLPAIRLPISSLRSQLILSHPRCRDLCSPTSTSMAIDYLLKKRAVDPAEFAEKVRDSAFDIYGNWILNIAESYHRLGSRFSCRVERLSGFSALHSHLSLGLPAVVSVLGPLPGSPMPYRNGHLILVAGWDPEKQQVITADPAYPSDEETFTSYAIGDFLNAWGRRKNLSYIFETKASAQARCISCDEHLNSLSRS